MNSLPTTNPPTLTRRWPRSRQSVGHARRELYELLSAWGLSPSSDAAALVLCELLTNALQHAPGPRECGIEVRIARADGGIRIEVHDEGAELPELRVAACGDEHGRGLMLVDSLTQGRWGVTGSKSGFKAVWALIGSPQDEGVPSSALPQ